jgi:hypothetical protein
MTLNHLREVEFHLVAENLRGSIAERGTNGSSNLSLLLKFIGRRTVMANSSTVKPYRDRTLLTCVARRGRSIPAGGLAKDRHKGVDVRIEPESARQFERATL